MTDTKPPGDVRRTNTHLIRDECVADADERRLRKAMWEEANRIIIDSTYSGRSHQAMGVRWEAIDRLTGVPATVLSSLGAAAAAVNALAHGRAWVTAALALAAAVLSGARSFLKSDEAANAHGLKGDRLISLKSDAVRFQQVDLASSLSLELLQDRLTDLDARRNALRETQPRHIPRKVYARTKKNIEAGESDYDNDHLWQESPY